MTEKPKGSEEFRKMLQDRKGALTAGSSERMKEGMIRRMNQTHDLAREREIARHKSYLQLSKQQFENHMASMKSLSGNDQDMFNQFFSGEKERHEAGVESQNQFHEQNLKRIEAMRVEALSKIK